MLSTFFKSMAHPGEIRSLFRLYAEQRTLRASKEPLDVLAAQLDDRTFCYETLRKVSRSFSVVIQQLPSELRDAVCIFYLVLRGLDSIEDDTSADVTARMTLLASLHEHLDDPSWSVEGIGDKQDYRTLLANFGKVVGCYQGLDPKYQEVIASICREMGQGMLQYLDRPIMTIAEYDEYCHYVAGLVGVGLSQLFVRSGLEEPEVARRTELSNSMGLFLQKTNIIRDFQEDLVEGRTFWPQEIWGHYGSRLDRFHRSRDASALHCLNHMITNALAHAADCLTYLRQINDPQVYQFCAIPQLMAMATLQKLYNNTQTFHRNEKIRKGLAASLIFRAGDHQVVVEMFHEMAEVMFDQIALIDPSAVRTTEHLQRIFEVRSHQTRPMLPQQEGSLDEHDHVLPAKELIRSNASL